MRPADGRGRAYVPDVDWRLARLLTPSWMALFDCMANTADRKAGHCLLDPSGEAFFVDHGLTFHTDVKLRTVIWDFAGEPLPEHARAGLEKALSELGALEQLVSRAELRALT